MAERYDEKPGRGLFGLGARRPAAAAPSPAAPPRSGRAPEPPQDGIEEMLVRLNLKAVAGAASLQASGREPALAAAELGLAPLTSRPVHYADIQSPWFAYWSQALHCAVRPHRKLWEFAVVMQALYEAGALVEGARALGFGVGDEPLPSYLASLGLNVVATDLAGEAERERVFQQAFVDGETFDARVEVSNLDIRQLDDPTLRGFDICWSASVLSQLNGMGEASDAILRSMDVLRPGGLAVHTADFAFAEDMPFSPVGGMSYSRAFFEKLGEQLTGLGHTVAPLSFDLGSHPLDGYVDLEPFEVDGPDAWRDLWREGGGAPHLKVCLGGQLKTSLVLIVRARG